MLAAMPGKPVGFNVVLEAENSTLSVDVPNADAAHVNEASIELVVADAKPGQSRKDTKATTYLVDTRPDATLAPYERADRKGPSGKAGVKLTRNGNAAQLNFRVTTAQGVEISGTVDCRKLDGAFGR